MKEKVLTRDFTRRVLHTTLEAYNAYAQVRPGPLKEALLQELALADMVTGSLAALCERVIDLENRIAALEQQRES